MNVDNQLREALSHLAKAHDALKQVDWAKPHVEDRELGDHLNALREHIGRAMGRGGSVVDRVKHIDHGRKQVAVYRMKQEPIHCFADEAEQVIPAHVGCHVVGYQDQHESGPQLCEELVGMPLFQGLCGPMFDGPSRVRYESWEVYNLLST